MSDNFWLSDEQFERLEPLLPSDARGVPRVDDRRVISGIIHVLQSGCRWRDAPAHYGPHKTLYNRFVRWERKDVWVGLFERLDEAGGPPEAVMLDSTHVKAHRSAVGGKGGRRPGDRPLTRRAHDQDPCRRRRARPATAADRAAGPSRRRAGGTRPHGGTGAGSVSCRWRPRQRFLSTPAGSTGGPRRSSPTIRPARGSTPSIARPTDFAMSSNVPSAGSRIGAGSRPVTTNSPEPSWPPSKSPPSSFIGYESIA